MDVLNNPIWFEGLFGIEESKIFLKDHFNLTELQLNLILTWINTSINGWLKNICEYTINDWNSALITTRTVNEWLFTAVDNLVNEQDPSKAKVSFFQNCFSETEAEIEDIKRKMMWNQFIVGWNTSWREGYVDFSEREKRLVRSYFGLHTDSTLNRFFK